ncbi:YadA-like family protein [Caballeronia cordobensis]|uniref:YadA-like family protein n=1 Tax=Caballeronia cordobensis TaxID=1353886 RepID=UPI00158CF601
MQNLSMNFGLVSKLGIGKEAAAKRDGDFAIGVKSKAEGGDSLALSSAARASGNQSVAIGVSATTARDGVGSVAIGRNAAAERGGDVALGEGASAAGETREALAYGSTFVEKRASALAVGADAKAKGTSAVALGGEANAVTYHATALGAGAKAQAKSSLAVGTLAVAAARESVALGAGSLADRPNTVSVGRADMARQVVNVAAGSRETDAVNVQQLKDLGARFNASGGASNSFLAYDNRQADSVTLRGAAGSRLTNLTAGVLESKSSDAVNGAQLFQTNENVKSVSDRMIDVKTTVDAIVHGGAGKYFSANSTRLPAHAIGSDALAVGAEASALGANAIAVGQLARAESNDSIALGSSSVADRANTVSVGNLRAKRQITNVADGTEDTDAVNVSQLRKAGLIDKKGITLDAIVYDAGSNRSSVTLGGIGATAVVSLTNVAAGQIGEKSTDAVNGGQLFRLTSRVDKLEKLAPRPTPLPDNSRPMPKVALDADNQVISNVASGVAESDAVNLGQLNAAMKAGIDSAFAHTDAEVARVRQDMAHDRKDASGGSASAIAIANLPQAYPGESMLSVAGGTFGGQSSVALGLSTATKRWSVKVSFTGNTRGSYGGGAGAGYRF